MELQFEVPKLIGAFLLGNLALAFFLARQIHPAFGLIHAAVAISTVLTGFGPQQLYPYAYWLGTVGLSVWVTGQDANAQTSIIKFVVASGLVVAFHAYLQMMGISWPLNYAPDIDSTTPIAMLGQQTKLGAFLAPCAAAALALGWLPACAFISFVAICTKSSFTFFALFVGLSVVYCEKYRRWKRNVWPLPLKAAIAAGIVLVCASPIFSATHETAETVALYRNIPALDDHGRGLVYKDLLHFWRKQPLLGYGPGGFKALFAGPYANLPFNGEYIKYSMQSARTYAIGGGWFFHAHNDYLELLFDFGLLFGALPLLYLLLSLYRAARDIWPARHTLAAEGILASMLINALGNFPWTLSPHFMIGTLAAAILLRASRP